MNCLNIRSMVFNPLVLLCSVLAVYKFVHAYKLSVLFLIRSGSLRKKKPAGSKRVLAESVFLESCKSHGNHFRFLQASSAGNSDLAIILFIKTRSEAVILYKITISVQETKFLRAFIICHHYLPRFHYLRFRRPAKTWKGATNCLIWWHFLLRAANWHFHRT